MQVNLESLVRQIVNSERGAKNEKVGLISILLYENGADNSGLSARIKEQGSVKDCFLKAKEANPVGYKVLCSRVAIHIVDAEEASQKKSEKSEYSSFKIPWKDVLEPFFQTAIEPDET